MCGVIFSIDHIVFAATRTQRAGLLARPGQFGFRPEAFTLEFPEIGATSESASFSGGAFVEFVVCDDERLAPALWFERTPRVIGLGFSSDAYAADTDWWDWSEAWRMNEDHVLPGGDVLNIHATGPHEQPRVRGKRDLSGDGRPIRDEPFRLREEDAKSCPGSTESSGDKTGSGTRGVLRTYAAPLICSAALPLATTSAPDSRARATAVFTEGSISSSDAIAHKGKSSSSAATGPCARSVAVSASAATRHVSFSLSATSRAVAYSRPRPATTIRPTKASGSASRRTSRASPGSASSARSATTRSASATSWPRPAACAARSASAASSFV